MTKTVNSGVHYYAECNVVPKGTFKLVIYKGRGKQPWRWRVVARNGKKLACSGEGFASKRNAEESYYKLKAAAECGEIQT